MQKIYQNKTHSSRTRLMRHKTLNNKKLSLTFLSLYDIIPKSIKELLQLAIKYKFE